MEGGREGVRESERGEGRRESESDCEREGRECFQQFMVERENLLIFIFQLI